jgi:hypothetical protein
VGDMTRHVSHVGDGLVRDILSTAPLTFTFVL